MKYCVTIFLLLAVLGGCAGKDGGGFRVFFQPYSSRLDVQGEAAVRSAAAFANAHPLMPVTLDGYTARPDPTNPDTLQEQRVATVKEALVNQGVGRLRIQVLGNGILYARGTPMPGLGNGQVNINIGL